MGKHSLVLVIKVADLVLTQHLEGFLLLPYQPVVDTFADVSELIDDFDYSPSTPIHEGVKNFANWFTKYYKY